MRVHVDVRHIRFGSAVARGQNLQQCDTKLNGLREQLRKARKYRDEYGYVRAHLFVHSSHAVLLLLLLNYSLAHPLAYGRLSLN